jgi:hypothetical protein
MHILMVNFCKCTEKDDDAWPMRVDDDTSDDSSSSAGTDNLPDTQSQDTAIDLRKLSIMLTKRYVTQPTQAPKTLPRPRSSPKGYFLGS